MNIFRCDQCSNEVQDEDVKCGWLEVSAMSEVMTFVEDDTDKHFCSWRCLGLYAFERVEAPS